LGIGDGRRTQPAAHPEVRRRLDRSVDEANARLARVDQIKRYAVLSDEWLPGGDELMPTMKLKLKARSPSSTWRRSRSCMREVGLAALVTGRRS
jgi:hypothetical protein